HQARGRMACQGRARCIGDAAGDITPGRPKSRIGGARMMHVIPFPLRSRPEGAPLMCFLDLQVEYVAEGRALALEERAPWMENCRRLLAFARAERMSIAHFRQLWRGTLLNPATPFAGWIEEFRPRPSE